MLDTIEPETKRYLKNVMTTVFVGLFWMFANVIAGIYFELAFIQGKLNIGNIIYFAIALVSFIFLVRYFIKMWTTTKKENT
jgi:hypothetical protein